MDLTKATPLSYLGSLHQSKASELAVSLSSDAQRPQSTIGRADVLVVSSSRTALANPKIVRLFAHYISVLAPW